MPAESMGAWQDVSMAYDALPSTSAHDVAPAQAHQSTDSMETPQQQPSRKVMSAEVYPLWQYAALAVYPEKLRAVR